MNWRHRQKPVSRHAPWPWLAILAACFLGGLLLGQAVLSAVPEETGEELWQYLRDFAALDDREFRSAAVLWNTLVLYIRYPLLAFAEGATSLGVFLLPLTAVVFALFLSFSVCCFTATFGGQGVLLALALFGIRCAVTLPCFFLLGVPALEHAWSKVSFGRGRRMRKAGYETTDWFRGGIVLVFLLAGWCVDRLVSPWLLETVLAGMTI